MNTASIQQIKQHLKSTDKKDLVEICLRLVKFKKENKELLSFLLFEADNEAAYITSVKEEIDAGFLQVNTTHLFFAKKTLRKVLRLVNKQSRYIGSKTADAELRMHYLTNFKGLNMQWRKQKLLLNLYEAQLKKIDDAINTMHEDLQHDYRRTFDRLKHL